MSRISSALQWSVRYDSPAIQRFLKRAEADLNRKASQNLKGFIKWNTRISCVAEQFAKPGEEVERRFHTLRIPNAGDHTSYLTIDVEEHELPELDSKGHARYQIHLRVSGADKTARIAVNPETDPADEVIRLLTKASEEWRGFARMYLACASIADQLLPEASSDSDE